MIKKEDFIKLLDEEDMDGIYKLVKRGISTDFFSIKNYKGCTALYIASERNNIELVKLLLEKGADVNGESMGKNTALHIASEKNNLFIANYLLKKGANVDARNARNETPLFKSCRINLIKMTKLLLDNGANPNITDITGKSALFPVCFFGFYEIAKLLINANIDLNITDLDNVTALELACWDGFIDIVKLMVENNADLNIKIKGEDILKWAIEREEYELVDMLVKKDAKLPIRWIIKENKKEALRIIINNKKHIPLIYENVDILAEAISRNNIEIVNLLMKNISNDLDYKIEKLREMLSTTRADNILENSHEGTKKKIKMLKREREREEIVDILCVRQNAKLRRKI